MPPLSILIKPASSACNLRCAYCFYADEASHRSVPNHGMMSEETAHSLIRKACQRAEGGISFFFQGGEPTLAGLDFYRRFLRLVAEENVRRLPVHYALQTNGVLLDEAWCRFFAENGFLVGLSLDGDQPCHDRYRLDSSGDGTYRRVLRGARLLQRAGVEYNLLIVVTNHLARHIRRVFASLCRGGFRFQQYIPCLDPLGGARGEESYSLTPKEYGDFLKQLFDLWYRELEKGQYYSIRYFDNLVRMAAGEPPDSCAMAGRCGIQYLVEADGSVYPCDFYGLDAYRMGSIQNNTWEELDEARERSGFLRASRALPERCAACRWYPLCRNGCRRERLLKDGQPEQSYYCSAYADFLPYALPRFPQVYRLVERLG